LIFLSSPPIFTSFLLFLSPFVAQVRRRKRNKETKNKERKETLESEKDVEKMEKDSLKLTSLRTCLPKHI
jgi:hypothetical protein